MSDKTTQRNALQRQDLPGTDGIIVAAAMDQELAHFRIPPRGEELPPSRRRLSWGLSAGTSPCIPFKRGIGPNVQLLKTGIGVAKTAENLRRRVEQESPRAVFGIGFAGGLSPELQAGD